MSLNFSQGGQGALGGAAAGATIGSIFPGIGTGIGAGAGALIGGGLGLFGGDEQGDLRKEQEARLLQALQADKFQGPQLGQFQSGSMGGPFRGGQLQLIGQLQEQAAGRGPSLATAQFQDSLNRGLNAQVAQSQSGVGNPALAGRGAANAIGGLTQDLAGQAARARVGEQFNARAQLGGLLGQGRGQEQQGSQFNAAQQNQRLLSQADMDLRAQALRQQQEQAMLKMLNKGFVPPQANQTGTQFLSGGGNLLAYGHNKGVFG